MVRTTEFGFEDFFAMGLALALGLVLGLALGLMLDLADDFNEGENDFFAVKVEGFLDGA